MLYFKCRHTRYSDLESTRSTGVDNPNYNNVYREAAHSKPRVPMDYEVPQPLLSTSTKYANVPHHQSGQTISNDNSVGSGSGIYSYVMVKRPSYDSNYLESTCESVDLLRVVAAETSDNRNGRLSTNYYSLVDNHVADN